MKLNRLILVQNLVLLMSTILVQRQSLSFQVPTFYTENGCVWTQYNNIQLVGGERRPNKTLSECLKECENWPGCHSLDWDPGQSIDRCWPYNSTNEYLQRNLAVTHYELKCPTGPYGDNNIGCYKLENQLNTTRNTNQTVESCVNLCRKQNKTYAAIQGGINCYCMDVFDTSQQSNNCTSTCNGNQSQYCGGQNGVYSIYTVCPIGLYGFGCDLPCHCEKQIPCDRNSGKCPNNKCDGNWTGISCNLSKTSDNYIGCIEDESNRLALAYQAGGVDDAIVGTSVYTYDTCLFTCTKKSYTYFGIEVGHCFCGNSYNTQRKVNETVCNVPCTASLSETCGGSSFLSLYSSCPPGFYGPKCYAKCNCANNSRCSYTDGVCPLLGPSRCKQGWTGNSCNIRDCKSNSGGCSTNETCVPMDLKYSSVNRCICETGYYRNNLWETCRDIDECSLRPHVCNVSRSACENNPGSFRCNCNQGYESKNLTLCEDIDECKRGDCDRNTTSNCTNTDGSFFCACRNGFFNQNDTHCSDINECLTREASCDLNSTTCVNTIGSYECNCKNGSVRDSNSRLRCLDIDECLNGEDNCNNATTICKNTIGGYLCNCIDGYTTRKEDNYSCEPPSHPETIAGAVVGAVLGVTLLILLIVLLVVFCRRRSAKRTDEILPEILNRPSARLSKVQSLYAVQDLPSKIRQQLSNEDKLRKEFQEINLTVHKFCEIGGEKELKKKNRFMNIIPYEFNRVILSQKGDDPKSEYINASYIQGFNESDKFIATQGPRSETIDDFWRMIYEKDVNVIVMITNLVESMKNKCEQYWPEVGQSAAYGEITVVTKSEDSWTDHIKRRIYVSTALKSIDVTQLHYINWHDHSVPNDVKSFLRFREIVRRHLHPDKYAVIHCSAGAGRTGTFLAIDYLIEQEKETRDVDIFGCFKELRNQRAAMVQNFTQYKFIHSSLLLAFTIGSTSIPKKGFLSIYKDLQSKQNRTGKTTLEKQFQSIEETEFDQEETDKLKVLSHVVDNNILKTANVAYVCSWRVTDAYVLTKMLDSVTDFWKLCKELKSKMILYIDSNQNSEISFLPTEDKPITLKDIELCLGNVKNEEYGTRYEVTETKQQHTYENSAKSDRVYNNEASNSPIYENSAIRSSELNNVLVLKIKQTVIKNLENVTSFLSLYDIVRNQSKTKTPVIVVYSNDCSAAGFCVAVFNALEMLILENEADLYQIVLNIRKSKPQLLSTLSAYEDLHSVVEKCI